MAYIKKRGNSYLIRISCGYDVSGRKITQSTTWHPDPKRSKMQNEKELNRFAVLFEEQCKGNMIVNAAKFETVAEEWFSTYAEKNYKPKTLERTKQLKARTYKAIGHLRIDKINARIIQKFINDLGGEGINIRTGGKLSPKTIKHYSTFISMVFSYAEKMQMISDNPCKNVILPKIAEHEKEIYTLEETQHILSLLQEAPTKYRALLTLAIYGGFRRGELLGLEWKDVDFNTNVVSIRRTALYTKEKGHYTDTPKTKGSVRDIKFPAEVINILKIHKAEQAKQILKVGDQWNETDRLFTTWNGKVMDGATPYNWFKKFCDRNNIRFLGLHSLRHLNASLLIQSGVNIRTVSACLGHSQTSTTLNIYAHSMDKANAEAMEAVADTLRLTISSNNNGSHNSTEKLG